MIREVAKYSMIYKSKNLKLVSFNMLITIFDFVHNVTATATNIPERIDTIENDIISLKLLKNGRRSVRFYRFHQLIRDPIKGALMFIKVYVASFWFALTSIPYTLGTRLFASQTPPPCPRESRRREGGAGR